MEEASEPTTSTFPTWLTEIVILVQRFPALGGLETFVRNISDIFRTYDVRVEIVPILRGEGFEPYTAKALLRRDSLHNRSLTGRRIFSVRSFLLTPMLILKRIDLQRGYRRIRRIVHTHRNGRIVLATCIQTAEFLVASGATGLKGRCLLVGQYHSSFDSLDYLFANGTQRAKSCFSRLDALIALDSSDAARFNELIPSVPVFDIPNPACSDRGPSTDASSRNLLNARPKVAVALARFAAEKQLDRLIDCFADVASNPEFSDWSLHVYGSGKKELSIQEAAHAARIRGAQVSVYAATSQPHEVLARAQVNLLASRVEGFGMTAVEAAIEGVPTVAFSCSPGIANVIRILDGVAVEPQNWESYAETLRELLRDTAQLARRGDNAREAVKLYSPVRIAELWSAAIATLNIDTGLRSDVAKTIRPSNQ